MVCNRFNTCSECHKKKALANTAYTSFLYGIFNRQGLLALYIDGIMAFIRELSVTDSMAPDSELWTKTRPKDVRTLEPDPCSMWVQHSVTSAQDRGHKVESSGETTRYLRDSNCFDTEAQMWCTGIAMALLDNGDELRRKKSRRGNSTLTSREALASVNLSFWNSCFAEDGGLISLIFEWSRYEPWLSLGPLPPPSVPLRDDHIVQRKAVTVRRSDMMDRQGRMWTVHVTEEL